MPRRVVHGVHIAKYAEYVKSIKGWLDIFFYRGIFRNMSKEPAPGPAERIITPMSKELLEKIDDFRFENRLASRSEAIRQLIEAGLAAKAPKAK